MKASDMKAVRVSLRRLEDEYPQTQENQHIPWQYLEIKEKEPIVPLLPCLEVKDADLHNSSHCLEIKEGRLHISSQCPEIKEQDVHKLSQCPEIKLDELYILSQYPDIKKEQLNSSLQCQIINHEELPISSQCSKIKEDGLYVSALYQEKKEEELHITSQYLEMNEEELHISSQCSDVKEEVLYISLQCPEIKDKELLISLQCLTIKEGGLKISSQCPKTEEQGQHILLQCPEIKCEELPTSSECPDIKEEELHSLLQCPVIKKDELHTSLLYPEIKEDELHIQTQLDASSQCSEIKKISHNSAHGRPYIFDWGANADEAPAARVEHVIDMADSPQMRKMAVVPEEYILCKLDTSQEPACTNITDDIGDLAELGSHGIDLLDILGQEVVQLLNDTNKCQALPIFKQFACYKLTFLEIQESLKVFTVRCGEFLRNATTILLNIERDITKCVSLPQMGFNYEV